MNFVLDEYYILKIMFNCNVVSMWFGVRYLGCIVEIWYIEINNFMIRICKVIYISCYVL